MARPEVLENAHHIIMHRGSDVSPISRRVKSSYETICSAINDSRRAIAYDEVGVIPDGWTAADDGKGKKSSPDGDKGKKKEEPQQQQRTYGANIYDLIAAAGAQCNEMELVKTRSRGPPSPEWGALCAAVPRCASAPGIRDSSVLRRPDAAAPQCLKRLMKELDGLRDHLPSEPNCSIWLRFDEGVCVSRSCCVACDSRLISSLTCPSPLCGAFAQTRRSTCGL